MLRVRPAVVAILTAFALLIRGVIATRGGVWADEGFFLSVVGAPSWGSMLEFLAAHESHPPLFYIIMRAWVSIAGDGDGAARLLPVLIGAGLIPAVYATGLSLFSARAALLAALLTAVAPSMSEHSAQLRPYGLLSLTALVSCWFMILSMDKGRLRHRLVYVVATLAMLYTHHWGWLIAAAQNLAWACVILSRRRTELGSEFRRWAAMWVAVVIGYLPWMSALAYQSTNAGHGGIPVDSVTDAAMLAGYGAFTLFTTILPGRFPSQVTVAGISFLLAACAAVYAHLVHRNDGRAEPEPHGALTYVARPVLGVTCVGTLGAAVLLSPFSNMLWPRCLTAVLPLLALLFADWCVRAVERNGARQAATLAAAVCSILFTNAAFELYVLATTPRSNAREAARLITRRSRPTDLVLIAPAWYRPSFTRYFASALEQAEFPRSNAGGLVDFSNVWERVSAPSELEGVMTIVERALASDRRVWVVTSRQYVRPVSDMEIAQAAKHHHPKPVTVAAVNSILASLSQQFGAADSTLLEEKRRPLYDDVRVYLYDPQSVNR